MCVRSHCIEIELRSPDCHWFDGTLKGLRWTEADKWFRFKPNGDISENFRKGPYSKVLPCKGKHNCVSFNFQFCFKIRDLQTSQTHKGRGSVTLLSLPCLNKKKYSLAAGTHRHKAHPCHFWGVIKYEEQAKQTSGTSCSGMYVAGINMEMDAALGTLEVVKAALAWQSFHVSVRCTVLPWF